MSDATRDPGPGPDAGEEAAWGELRARWGDPLAHRAFLDHFHDLDGLARAGARYRAALAARPDDPAALAGRDEVMRRAAILGLAMAPRTAPPAGRPWARRGVALAAGAAAVLAAIAAASLLRCGGVR